MVLTEKNYDEILTKLKEMLNGHNAVTADVVDGEAIEPRHLHNCYFAKDFNEITEDKAIRFMADDQEPFLTNIDLGNDVIIKDNTIIIIAGIITYALTIKGGNY